MEYYKNILCISYTELIQGDPKDPDEVRRPILTEANFKYYKSKDKFRVLRRACYGTPALIAYNSLPMPIKEKVVAKYGDPEKNVQNYVLKDMVVYDLRAEKFYRDYALDEKGYKGLDTDKQKEYTWNASVLNAIVALTSNRSLFIRARGKGTLRVWPETSEMLNPIQRELGCNLPKNHIALKRVVEKYKEGGYASLISGKFSNNNARKNKEAEQEALIVELLGDGRNIDNETIAKLYNAVAERMEWKTISASTIANYKKEHPEHYAGKHGEKALANDKKMQHDRIKPTCPMYFWCVDGWDAELFYQKTYVNEKNHKVTTYHNRPTMVAIVDPFNEYIIGYAIGTHETPALIRQAFRNAFEHIRELFGGYFRPWQLQTDNYQKSNLKPFYEACTKYFTPAAVGNSKAKMIEPFFNRFCRKYTRLLPNSSGHGVKSRQKIQVSDDWIEKHKKDFPDYVGCRAQLTQFIEFDRNTKREEYLKKWNNMPEDKHLAFSDKDFLSTFGEVTGYTNRLTGPGIVLHLEGEKYVFDSFDLELRDYGHASFIIRYNPSDMSKALAIVNDGTEKEPVEGTVRFVVEQKKKEFMAIMDQGDEDHAQRKRVNDYNDAMVEAIIQKRAKSGEIVREFFDENEEKLKNTLTAHIITDSLGQHKDRRNEVAGRGKTKKLPVQKAVPVDNDDYEMVMDEQDIFNEF